MLRSPKDEYYARQEVNDAKDEKRPDQDNLNCLIHEENRIKRAKNGQRKRTNHNYTCKNDDAAHSNGNPFFDL